MKLLFSEAKADYDHYIFPYAIWAFPETGEAPGDLFNQGFLPSSRNLDRFYLCRQVRVNLARFKPSSENRRILRKFHLSPSPPSTPPLPALSPARSGGEGGPAIAGPGEGDVHGEGHKTPGLDVKLVPRAQFDYTPERRQCYKTYADIKFGKDVMNFERLDALFASPIVSHLLVFTDVHAGAEVGTVTLYIESGALAYYYYAFYDLDYYARNLGMFMMTSAVARFAEMGLRFLYLGTCYSRNALYKTQFAGAEFFNGFRWSNNLDELKFLLRREDTEQHQHLLESEEFRETFYSGDLTKITSAFRVNIGMRVV